jgi:Uma2 family endonuclease
MPDLPHAAIQTYLMVVLYHFLARAGIGRCFPELHCIFGPIGRERAYVPDLVCVLNAHLPVPRYLHCAPDLAVEVLSPDQNWAQFLDKIQFYLLNGVRLIWVFDPATSTVTVEALGEEARILRPGDTLDGGDVLPGFSVPVADIFAEVDR